MLTGERDPAMPFARELLDQLQRRLAEHLPSVVHELDRVHRWTSGRLQTPRGLLHALDPELLADRPVLRPLRRILERVAPRRSATLATDTVAEQAKPPSADNNFVPVGRLR